MTNSSRRPSSVPVRRYRYSKWRWRVLVGVFDLLGSAALRIWRLVRAAQTIDAPQRILIVQLDHMGDAVLTSPLLERLRFAYPEAEIDVLASPSNREVFEADPNIRRVHVAERSWFDRRPGQTALLSAVWRLGTSLRKESYDLGIDVRGDVLSVLVLTLAGIPRRLGWAMGGGGFLLTDVVAWVPRRHEVESRIALADRLGIQCNDPPRVSVPVSDRDRIRVGRSLSRSFRVRAKRGRQIVTTRQVRDRPRAVTPAFLDHRDEPDALHAGRFGASAPLVAIHPGAGTLAKRWPDRHWNALISHFLEDGWRVLVVGGSDAKSISRSLPHHKNLRDWTGRLTISETTALLERADFFIGADSGPSHLAACARVPSVVLFSGTNDVRQWRPWSRRSLVIRHRVTCQPCHNKVCPLMDHPCLTRITPERVYRTSRRWWGRLHREESPHAAL